MKRWIDRWTEKKRKWLFSCEQIDFFSRFSTHKWRDLIAFTLWLLEIMNQDGSSVGWSLSPESSPLLLISNTVPVPSFHPFFSSLFFIPHIFIPNIFIALLCISSLVFHPLVNLISSMYFHPLLLHHVFSSCFPFIQAFNFSSAKRRCQITSKLHCCCAC